MSRIPQSARDAVAARSMGLCERCGGAGSEIHHRQRRRDGGHAVENLVNLCGTDHRWAHANPEAAKIKGFIVDPWVEDMAEVPIKTYSEWVLFRSDGEVDYRLPVNLADARDYLTESESS